MGEKASLRQKIFRVLAFIIYVPFFTLLIIVYVQESFDINFQLGSDNKDVVVATSGSTSNSGSPPVPKSDTDCSESDSLLNRMLCGSNSKNEKVQKNDLPPSSDRSLPDLSSFDCIDIDSVLEKIVCESESLAGMDQEIGELYLTYLRSLGGEEQMKLIAFHVQWKLKLSKTCDLPTNLKKLRKELESDFVDCLSELYIEQLFDYRDRVEQSRVWSGLQPFRTDLSPLGSFDMGKTILAGVSHSWRLMEWENARNEKLETLGLKYLQAAFDGGVGDAYLMIANRSSEGINDDLLKKAVNMGGKEALKELFSRLVMSNKTKRSFYEAEEYRKEADKSGVILGELELNILKYCLETEKIQIPPTDIPSKEFLEGMEGCDSPSLYYGIGGSKDYEKARHCAYGESIGVNGLGGGRYSLLEGDVMLMMIYANGKGVVPNIEVAQMLACRAPYWAPAEFEYRTEYFYKLRNSSKMDSVGEVSDCDFVTSGQKAIFCRNLREVLDNQTGEHNQLNEIDSCPDVVNPDSYRVFASVSDKGLSISGNGFEITKAVSNYQKHSSYLHEKNEYLFAQSVDNWVLIPTKKPDYDVGGTMRIARYVDSFFILNGKVVENFAFPVISYGTPHFVVHNLDGAKFGDSLIIVDLSNLSSTLIGDSVWRYVLYNVTDRVPPECCEKMKPDFDHNIGSSNTALQVHSTENGGFLITVNQDANLKMVYDSTTRKVNSCVSR